MVAKRSKSVADRGADTNQGASRALTPRQQAFVEEYLVDLNATQAAIRAGYSAKVANREGSRLLSNAVITEALVAAREARSRRTAIDADWVLRRLVEEAEADIADLYDANGGLKPVHEWPLIWRKGLVAGIEVEEVRGEEDVIGYVKKLKLSDRFKRIERIGDHVTVGAFAKQSPDVNLTLNRVEVNVTQVVKDELAEAFDAARGAAIDATREH